MKILVTGASGFLGRHLTKKLKSKGHKVYEISTKNCDLTIQKSLNELFKNIIFDQIYHLAAWTQVGDFRLHQLGKQWILNQKINTNVLSWWKDSQPQAKLVCIGTSASYVSELELKEENYLKGEPIENWATYVQIKRTLYIGLQAINNQFGLNYMYFVPSTLYGPDYIYLKEKQLPFIFDLIRKILRGKIHGEEVVLWGDGYQNREIVYVNDFVNIMIGLNKRLSNKIINIGAGEGHNIRYFAKKICNIVGYDFKKIKFDETKPTGAKSKCLDISSFEKVLPNYPFKDLDECLKETIDWMKQSVWVD